MSEIDPRVEAFYAKANQWYEELRALRRILLESPLTETFKWRGPCYTYDRGNVAMPSGFRDSCGLGFFKGVLLRDARHLLVSPGENSRQVRMFKFRSVAEIEAMEAEIKAYIREAIELEVAGAKVDLPKDDFDYPEELVERLEQDPELGAAFDALTPGRKRGYALYFSQPKQPQTRFSRIEKCVPRILTGKGYQER